VTGEAGCDHYSMATEGQPDQPQITVSNDVIHAVLDVLDQSEEDQALQQDPPVQCKEDAQIVEPVDEEKGNGVVPYFPQQPHLGLSTVISQGPGKLFTSGRA
jgi:hypothetical protein